MVSSYAVGQNIENSYHQPADAGHLLGRLGQDIMSYFIEVENDAIARGVNGTPGDTIRRVSTYFPGSSHILQRKSGGASSVSHRWPIATGTLAAAQNRRIRAQSVRRT
jgi:hypothetical protein